jgi:hypothetical protein
VTVCLTVRRVILKPTYEDFQDKAYEDFKSMYMKIF